MKNLKKSILLVTALFVTTGALADKNYAHCNGVKEYKKSSKNYAKHKGYHNDKKERRTHRGDISRFFIGAVYDLDLTKEQNQKIDKTLREFRNKRFDRFNGFTKNGFDKQKFIEARKNAKEDKIKLKADLIEKIYSMLTKEQIVQMNKEIEMFKKMKEVEEYKRMKKNRGLYDKHSNDRG